MARLTLDQINALIPNDAAILSQSGITQTVGDDGNPVYRDSEGQKVNPGQIEQILSGRDQARQQALTQNGIIQLPSEQGDFSFFNRSNGTNFQNLTDYYNYLYGGGDQIGNVGTQDGSYFVLPEGQSTTDYKNAPLSYNPPPSTGYRLAQMGVLGLATAGLGGYLPGTESAFGGIGAGLDAGINAGGLDGALGDTFINGITPGTYGGWAGAGAAGAAGGGSLADIPSFTGGASGGDVAGVSGGFSGGGSGAGVSGAIGGGLSGAEGAGLSGGGTALSRLLAGNATDADKLQLAGSLGSSLLGAYGANQQAGAYSDVADKYLGLGAPFRQKLEASYAPGFDLTTADPAFGGALDAAAQAAARATSARSGNPIDNPGAYSEMQKYILNSSVLPQLNTYRSQLGSFGQLGVNTAGTNDTQAAGQTTGTYNALGYGLGQLTQPKNPFEDAMKGILSGLRLNPSNSLA